MATSLLVCTCSSKAADDADGTIHNNQICASAATEAIACPIATSTTQTWVSYTQATIAHSNTTSDSFDVAIFLPANADPPVDKEVDATTDGVLVDAAETIAILVAKKDANPVAIKTDDTHATVDYGATLNAADKIVATLAEEDVATQDAAATPADANATITPRVCLLPAHHYSVVPESPNSTFQGCLFVITMSLMADGDDDTIRTFLGNILAAEDPALVKSKQACWPLVGVECALVERSATTPRASHLALSHAPKLALHQLAHCDAMDASSHGHSCIAANRLRHSIVSFSLCKRKAIVVAPHCTYCIGCIHRSSFNPWHCSALISHNRDDEDGAAKATHPLTECMKAINSTYILLPASTFTKKLPLQATTLLSPWRCITFDPGGQVDHSSLLYNQFYSPYTLSSISTLLSQLGFVLSSHLQGRMYGLQYCEITHGIDTTKFFKSRPKQQSELLIFFIMKSTIDPG